MQYFQPEVHLLLQIRDGIRDDFQIPIPSRKFYQNPDPVPSRKTKSVSRPVPSRNLKKFQKSQINFT